MRLSAFCHATSASSKNYLRRQATDQFVLQAQAAGLRSRAAFKLLDLNDRFRVIKKGDLVVDLGAAPGSWSQVAVDLAGLPAGKHKGREQGASANSSRVAGVSPTPLPTTAPNASPRPSPVRRSLFSLTSSSYPVQVAPSPQVPVLSSSPLPPSSPSSSPSFSVIALDLLPIEPPIEGVLSLQGDFTSKPVQERLIAAMRGKRADVVLSDMAHSFSGISDSDAAIQLYLAWQALLFAASHLKQGGNVAIKARYGENYKLLVDLVKKTFRRGVEAKPPASRQESAECYVVGLGAKADFVAVGSAGGPRWVEEDAAVKDALAKIGLLK